MAVRFRLPPGSPVDPPPHQVRLGVPFGLTVWLESNHPSERALVLYELRNDSSLFFAEEPEPAKRAKRRALVPSSSPTPHDHRMVLLNGGGPTPEAAELRVRVKGQDGPPSATYIILPIG